MDRGLRLRELRESKRLSQTEAARHIGVSKQTLYKYENNIITNIPSDIIERIATLYETTPAYLMGWEEDRDMSTAHRELLEAYVNRERLSQYSPEQINRALNFLDAFTKASPEIQAAIETLLKGRQSGL